MSSSVKDFYRKYEWAILLGLAVVIVGGIIVINNTGDAAPTKKTTVSQQEKPVSEPISLSGSGNTATDSFSLNEGLATFKLTHSGSRNFLVNVYDQDAGKFYDGLVNEVGAYNGSRVLPINATGNYRLDIVADGPWTVTITQ